MWQDAFEEAQATATTLPFDAIILRISVIGAIVVAAGISPSRMRVPNSVSLAPIPAAIISATSIVVVIAVMAVAIPPRAIGIGIGIATASAASAAMAVAAGSIARPVLGIHAARIISF